MPAVRHVNGFYPWPVPVSLTDEAAVFASGGALYRVDARMNARRQDLAGEITQVVQTEQGVRALTWARNGRAELVRLDERLQVLGRRQLLPGGTAPRRGMEDLYTGYFDGQLAFDGREGFRALALDGTRSGNWTRAARNVHPIVLWRDRLLLDLEGTGRPKAYSVQFDPAAGRELAWE